MTGFIKKYYWLAVAGLSVLIVCLPFLMAGSEPVASSSALDRPAEFLKIRKPHLDHSAFFDSAFSSGPAVTQACLKCHENAAHEIMQTTHWTWESDSLEVDWRKGKFVLGKKNGFNNFCLNIGGNWQKCNSCHIGYGWKDKSFDFKNPSLVDCLVCHDNSGSYLKGNAGLPAEGSDLLAAAKSVGLPTRENCGACHFNGGGGNAVKHGDLDQTLRNPTEDLDVHMGRHKMECIDCHGGEHHNIIGKSMSVSVDRNNRARCTDCHSESPHTVERLNTHGKAIACQTCHIPEVARKEATKTHWDWSQAGQDREDVEHHYMKMKGEFIYQTNLVPEYAWYNETSKMYIKGDSIAAEGVTLINQPLGDIADSSAKIWPFKVHRAKQPYDKVYRYLLPPKTVDGYWEHYDWKRALQDGADIAGLKFSGEFGFAETEMSWPLSHMVTPKQKALSCTDCHSPNGRMDWQALGYNGDPMRTRGRLEQ
jgi:octaheme c-type cytochrome (tetrathionate reductase family)